MWEKCLEIFRDNLDTEQFNAWFAPIQILSCEGNQVTVKVPSMFFVEQIEGRYYGLLVSTLRRVFGDKVQLTYNYDIVSNQPETNVAVHSDNRSAIVDNKVTSQWRTSGNPFEAVEYADIDPQLNPRYTFENYCDSICNKLPVSIAQAIVDNPKIKTFNPLFVFGPCGVGKTHLIQAIGLKLKERNPGMRVLYLTARVFETQFVKAVQDKRIPDFINFYSSIDVLLLDDIQDLAGKKGTQNTFYHIFNELHNHGKQLIMSSDTRPSELDGLEPRLISRFKWGMTVEIEKPDFELRRSVLQLKAQQDGLDLPADVLDYIAENVTDSVRELEGIVVSLLAHATMLGRDISVDLARTVVANAVRVTQRQISFEQIAETVCDYYNIDSSLLYGKSRKREISDARQLVMYLAKRETQLSSTNIGMRLSRNHATVLHACKQIEQRLTVEKKFQDDVAAIEGALKQ